MKKSFAIIGLGRFGLALARTLVSLKCDVLGIERNTERANKASKYLPNCVICDATKKENLEELGIKNVDEVIIAIGEHLEATILTIINLKELGVKKISVRVDDAIYESAFKRLGADETFTPEEDFGVEYAKTIAKSNNIEDYFEINDHYGIVKFTVKDDFEAKSIVELDIKRKFDVLIVSIIKNEKTLLPHGEDLIEGGNEIYVVGKYEKTLKFENFINN